MKLTYLHQLCPIAAIAAIAGGCAGEARTPDSASAGVLEILVAPWEVDSLASYACYKIEVHDAAGNVVWGDDSICTDTFSLGANGTLGYVGVCEAGPTGSSTNHVSISLTRLVADDGSELGNWGDHPPTFSDDFVCNVNEDTVVRAAFLVITPGTKGFLDVSVDVNEIDCNAKVDCRDDFLSSSADAGPEGTVVVALTCETANLYMDNLVLTCLDPLGVETSVTVDPSSGPGAHDGYPSGFVFGVISNEGASTDGKSSFWNLSIGISGGYHDCHLTTRMTAGNGDFGEIDVYPTIVANVAFGFAADGSFACVNPLDGDGSGIVTDWDDDVDYDNCLTPDATTPIDLSDVIVENCVPGPDCLPGFSDPDNDGICTPIPLTVCDPGMSDPDNDGICTPIPLTVCDPGMSDPDNDGICTPIPLTVCDPGFSDPDNDGICTPIPVVCDAGFSDPDGDGICTPIPVVCDEGFSDPDDDGICTPIPVVCDEGFSDPDGDDICTADPEEDNCTYTQGYWKNHAEAAIDQTHVLGWPAPEDESTLLCGSTWLTVLGTPPAQGNAWYILAHQWIAARLNVASGADVPLEVSAAMAEAEALLTANCTALSRADRSRAVALAAILESYNSGDAGPGACVCRWNH